MSSPLAGQTAVGYPSSRACTQGHGCHLTNKCVLTVCRPDGSRPLIYLKREDLNHTGAHKINNSLGQALLCRRMGKKRIIAETGAGQHGVATVRWCTICFLYA